MSILHVIYNYKENPSSTFNNDGNIIIKKKSSLNIYTSYLLFNAMWSMWGLKEIEHLSFKGKSRVCPQWPQTFHIKSEMPQNVDVDTTILQSCNTKHIWGFANWIHYFGKWNHPIVTIEFIVIAFTQALKDVAKLLYIMMKCVMNNILMLQNALIERLNSLLNKPTIQYVVNWRQFHY